jgi:hypothetical protein
MAPINLEDNLKEKLEHRELQPSANAWERLSDRLDENSTKNKSKRFWWIGMAASFIGILLIASFLFNANGNKNIEPVIVDTEAIQNEETKTEVSESIDEPDQDVNAIQTSNATKNQVIQTPVKNAIAATSLNEEQQKIVPDKMNKVKEPIDEVKKEKLVSELPKQNATLAFEDQKVNAVVAEIRAMQERNDSITEKEIDALLNAAQKEITLNKLYNEATKTVDADALLRSVEDDLDHSFRDRVFKLLQSGYEEVKTAVADRNN